MRRRSFLAGAAGLIATPVLAGPAHPGRLLIPTRGAGGCAPHQLLENSNWSNQTGSIPSGWGDGGAASVAYADQGGYFEATLTLAGAATESIWNFIDYTDSAAQTGGMYIKSIAGLTGSETLLWVGYGGAGETQAEITAADFSGEGWYASGFQGGPGDLQGRFYVGGKDSGTQSGTLVCSRPFQIYGSLPGAEPGNVTKLSGPPLGEWIGTDDGDEPLGSCNP